MEMNFTSLEKTPRLHSYCSKVENGNSNQRENEKLASSNRPISDPLREQTGFTNSPIQEDACSVIFEAAKHRERLNKMRLEFITNQSDFLSRRINLFDDLAALKPTSLAFSLASNKQSQNSTPRENHCVLSPHTPSHSYAPSDTHFSADPLDFHGDQPQRNSTKVCLQKPNFQSHSSVYDPYKNEISTSDPQKISTIQIRPVEDITFEPQFAEQIHVPSSSEMAAAYNSSSILLSPSSPSSDEDVEGQYYDAESGLSYISRPLTKADNQISHSSNLSNLQSFVFSNENSANFVDRRFESHTFPKDIFQRRFRGIIPVNVAADSGGLPVIFERSESQAPSSPSAGGDEDNTITG
ncbi:unnamed protein product [Protopolystoma xenopodis]|uniref:Uncharacterized protein n=1 Tax=Protopolystoma xenopodis TaxID=117903 RepID=A0A448WWG7_9PLAT|nr:unnamed protein product [Protopolystoma xenopodis]